MDPQTDAAVSRLAESLHRSADDRQREPMQILGPILYQLWTVTRNDLSPESAVLVAGQRVQPPITEPARNQLLADWRLASRYGLLTPDNLSRLQRGLPPVAADGRFVGQMMNVAKIHPNNPFPYLTDLAFCPAGQPIPDEALAQPTRPALVSTTGQFRTPGTYHPTAIVPVPPRAYDLRPAHIELHDVPFNGSLPLGGTRKLAVASDSGSVLSVSVVGDGPKVHRAANVSHYSGGTSYSQTVEADFPRVDNAKVPKVNPIRLPGVDGDAYLIHTEANARFYFIDTTVNNGAAFRIATVPLSL